MAKTYSQTDGSNKYRATPFLNLSHLFLFNRSFNFEIQLFLKSYLSLTSTALGLFVPSQTSPPV